MKTMTRVEKKAIQFVDFSDTNEKFSVTILNDTVKLELIIPMRNGFKTVLIRKKTVGGLPEYGVSCEDHSTGNHRFLHDIFSTEKMLEELLKVLQGNEFFNISFRSIWADVCEEIRNLDEY